MKLSVIIPAYNVEKYVRNAVDSALEYTDEAIEVIVVDDGSTDRTRAVLNSFDDRRLKIIDRQNGGLPAARNTGLSHATGDYVAELDGDDIAVVSGWQALIEALDRNPDAVLAYGVYRRFFGDGNVFDRTAPFLRRWKPKGDVRRRIVCGNFVQPGTVVVRRGALVQAGGHNETLTIGEDWETWCRLSCLGSFLFLPVMTLGYRQRPEGMMSAPRPVWFLEESMKAIDAVFAYPDLEAALGNDLERCRKRALAHALFGVSLLLGRQRGSLAQALSYLVRAAALDPARSLFFGAVFASRTFTDRDSLR